MKVILSRKGFDSQYGGIASPILPDGRLVPLPIPSEHDDATFSCLNFQNIPFVDIIHDLSGGKYNLQSHVHCDPDLGGKNSESVHDWRPTFGQTHIAQSHLSNNGVGSGDVFLFFGWFRRAERVDHKWRFVPNAPDLHVIFGWLEVDEVLPIAEQRENAIRRYPWIVQHPHVAHPEQYRDPRNTLYVGRPRSAFTKTPSVGGGRFRWMQPHLQLTCPGRTRSVWLLPRWFAPQGRPPLSYHPRSEQWVIQGDNVILHSAAKGQEFIIDGKFYPEIQPWLSNLICEAA